MAILQDKLITLPQKYYADYLRIGYAEMAKYVPEDAYIIEIGARNDRGVISKQVIPHRTFISVDRNLSRGDLHTNVLVEDLPDADVVISTCVLHHTKEVDICQLLSHMNAPLLMFSGPNADVMPELFGDHLWHIEIDKLSGWLEDLGYIVEWSPIGLSEPFCELLVIAR